MNGRPRVEMTNKNGKKMGTKELMYQVGYVKSGQEVPLRQRGLLLRDGQRSDGKDEWKLGKLEKERAKMKWIFVVLIRFLRTWLQYD